MDWSTFSPPSNAKRQGSEYHIPCPVHGGRDSTWAHPEQQTIGCRKCSANGSGRIPDAVLEGHARAFGIWSEVNLGGSNSWGEKVDTWTWSTAAGCAREQYRWSNHPNDDKTWQPTVPKNDPPPADLMYLPGGVPDAAVIYMTEGASDADAVHAAGLPVIGRNNARPSSTSLSRLRKDAVYRIWPDHDHKDGAGYKQAVMWDGAMTEAGLRVEVLDPFLLNPAIAADPDRDDFNGYDARDWIATAPADPGAVLGAAVVSLVSIRSRIPDQPAPKRTEPQEQSLTAGRLVTGEDEMGEVFALEQGRDYAHRARQGWLRWNGSRWEDDQHDHLLRDLQGFGRHRWGRKSEEGLKPDPKTGSRKTTAGGVETNLRSRLAADDWDTDPMVLGLPDGQILHLGTGVVRDRTRGDRITRSVGAAPARIAGHWTADPWFRFLDEALPPDAVDWVQTVCGYAATGLTEEHLLLFCYGRAGSGKGTFLTAIADCLGDYSRRINPDDLMDSVGEQHPAWLADLDGRRLVIGDEIPRGRRWATGRVKSLVSGERIRARKMRQDFFEFKPAAQLILAANHAPAVQSRDTGLVRRLAVLPFDKRPNRPNPRLSAEINLGVVMTWIAEGARRYFRDGLSPEDTPASVSAATAVYHATADPLSGFVESLPVGEWITRSEVGKRYEAWAIENGIRKPLTRQMVLSTLREDYEARERVVRGTRQIRLEGARGAKVQDPPISAHTPAPENKQGNGAPSAPLAPSGVLRDPAATPEARHAAWLEGRRHFAVEHDHMMSMAGLSGDANPWRDGAEQPAETDERIF